MKTLLLTVLTFCLCSFASDSKLQEPGTSQSSSQDTTQSDKPIADSAPERDGQDKPQKKRKKKKSDEQNDLNAPTFSEAAAEVVMGRIRDGLEGHSQRLMLSIFDTDKMSDYPRFENQIEAFFTHYQTFRVHTRIIEATAEGETGAILCDFEMEASPVGDAPPVRKQHELRLELERGGKGWRIVDLKPRDFFS